MRVPAVVLSEEQMLDSLTADRSLEQLINVATLPGIMKAAVVMPDAHEGYGFPIGGVAATHYPDGVISPGGIGYDINCGVRLLRTDMSFDQVEPHLDALSKELYGQIPSGVGKGGQVRVNTKKIDEVLTSGAQWAINNGYGNPEDLEFLESKYPIENLPVSPSTLQKDRITGKP